MIEPAGTPRTPMLHALTFDIEDWFHLAGVKAVEDPAGWAALSEESSLVERYTDVILRICDDHGVHGTFFILGWIARRHPALCKRIADAGHEIGTHSFWHRRVFDLDPDTFRRDVAESLDAIGAATGVRARTFRAPSFSITPDADWAFEVLAELGFESDASLVPTPRGRGGSFGRRGPHTLKTPSDRTLCELPMSLMDLGPRRVCYSGGGYLRLLPWWVIERALRAEAAAGRPTVVYLHPRDFASDCPRVPMPLHRRFMCTVGSGSTEAKLRRLLTAHRWGTCRAVLGLERATSVPRGVPAPAPAP